MRTAMILPPNLYRNMNANSILKNRATRHALRAKWYIPGAAATADQRVAGNFPLGPADPRVFLLRAAPHYASAIRSISTRKSRGSRATSTVVRAGGSFGK